ncbi:GAF domain protein [Desulfosarcina cetonica]|uniref:GAF domain-containing protein n=1 Tax=Desulfosarcina cetonica TaxID=90730 RepID=UPI0006D29D46|nr:GAF domain-containing protein [Desulfosarcina cetonica]VTR70879.1 GAF domain protein [Desulfosarcina cetonica]
MASENRINIDIFKSVTRAIAHSEDLDIMANHLAQMLTASLDVKGCAIFVLNAVTEELEILASFGLSAKYLTKGPLNTPKSINETFKGHPVVIADIQQKNQNLQYPEEARKEGIAAIVSLPIIHLDEVIGVLRLYHFEPWKVSDQDLDALQVLAGVVGLAMMYTRFHNTVHAIAEVLGHTFQVQLTAKAGRK